MPVSVPRTSLTPSGALARLMRRRKKHPSTSHPPSIQQERSGSSDVWSHVPETASSRLPRPSRALAALLDAQPRPVSALVYLEPCPPSLDLWLLRNTTVDFA